MEELEGIQERYERIERIRDNISKGYEDDFIHIGDSDIEKGKKMPIGTISGKYKKVAEGKWVEIKQGGEKNKKMEEPGKEKSNKEEGEKPKIDHIVAEKQAKAVSSDILKKVIMKEGVDEVLKNAAKKELTSRGEKWEPEEEEENMFERETKEEEKAGEDAGGYKEAKKEEIQKKEQSDIDPSKIDSESDYQPYRAITSKDVGGKQIGGGSGDGYTAYEVDPKYGGSKLAKEHAQYLNRKKFFAGTHDIKGRKIKEEDVKARKNAEEENRELRGEDKLKHFYANENLPFILGEEDKDGHNKVLYKDKKGVFTEGEEGKKYLWQPKKEKEIKKALEILKLK